MQHVHQGPNNTEKIKVFKNEVLFFSPLNSLYDKTVRRFLTLTNDQLLLRETIWFSFLP